MRTHWPVLDGLKHQGPTADRFRKRFFFTDDGSQREGVQGGHNPVESVGQTDQRNGGGAGTSIHSPGRRIDADRDSGFSGEE